MRALTWILAVPLFATAALLAGPAHASTHDDDLSGDLRPEALAVIQARHDPAAPPSQTVAELRTTLRWPVPRAATPGPPPATIRVWRRGLDGSTASCSGRVDVIPLERYVQGVLPHEWIASWDDRALEAGAVTIRTYAWSWIAMGGKYTCADLDDTTASQVYKDDTNPKTNADVDATAGIAIVRGGSLVFAEYSAENGDPTADGVAEPHCAGQTVFGHGHGTCQWGTQRWATSEGKDYAWMASHYYPGATVLLPGAAYAASFSAEDYPKTMTSGDEAVVYLEYTNDGTTTWDATGTRVGTTGPRDRASAFYKDGNWLSPSRPTAADHSGYGAGSVGRFSFVLRAPDVDVPTAFVEHFGLVQEGVTWFGPEDNAVAWMITVVPKGSAGGGDAGAQGGAPDAGSGGPGNPGDPSGTGAGAPTVAGCSIGAAGALQRPTGVDPRTAVMLLFAVALGRQGKRFRMVSAARRRAKTKS